MESEEYKRIDLALIDGQKGVLKLDEECLSFSGKKGKVIELPLKQIGNVKFLKTSLSTSTLYVDDLTITVCRAHLWAADILDARKALMHDGSSG